jgi:flagellar motor switch protein FliN
MNDQFSDDELDNLINEAALQAETAGDAGADAGGSVGQEPVQPEAPRLPQHDLSFFGKIPVQVTLEVASVQLPLKDLMEVDVSTVIALDKLAGEPLDVKVNGALFARAEVVVLNGNYGLRILELSGPGLRDIAS